MQAFYSDKARAYFSNVRKDVIASLPDTGKHIKVLEIGSGSCDTLVYMKERGLAGEAWGLELMRMEGSNQDNKLVDRLFIGTVDEKLPELPEGYFDVVICADVLEHLEAPWQTVKALVGKLKPGGYLAASIPNFREAGNMFTIFLKGDFRYQDHGILDRTHLRFFCRRNIKELFAIPELELVSIKSNIHAGQPMGYRRFTDLVTFGLMRDILSKQYIVVSKKVAP